MEAIASSATQLRNLGPFASLRDYMAALEARGKVLRIKELDQDAYEATALTYRLIDRYGWTGGPTLVIERIKIDGEWMDGPIIVNNYGDWDCEPIALGLEPAGPDRRENYKAAVAHCERMPGENGQWQTVDPVEVAAAQAPCKEIVLTGDDVDIQRFPFIQSNPADGGRFVNTGNLVLIHPEQGRNVGTYRCHIKGPRRLGVNPEPNQHAWTMLMDLKKKGESSVKVAIVQGADPIVFAMSSSKTARLGQDELQIAGGFLGRPLELVRCEDSDILVPANVEMVIEGVISLTETEPEGPFGEMYGYLGAKKAENFVMDLTTITHRRNPWFVNQFTGVTRGFLTSPMEATANLAFRNVVPNLQNIHLPVDLTGFCFLSIDKEAPGDAFKAAEPITKFLNIAKIICVFDKDVDIHNSGEALHALGSRWRPHPATKIIESGPGMRLDPGVREADRERLDLTSSKIVIDATRPWPEENGPDVYPKLNREWLQELCPDAFPRIDRKISELLKDWSG